MSCLPRPVFLAAFAVCGVVSPRLAEAHAILEESTPAANATLHAGPIDLTFRYNSRIDAGRSRLLLTRPDRTQTPVPIIADAKPDILQAHLDLPPGTYSVRWQVLATDGHITRGDVPFTLTGN